MPKRMLDGDISYSHSLNQLTDGGETCFYRVMVLCDDKGRFDGRMDYLFSRLYPMKPRITRPIVAKRLQELEREGLVHWYDVEGKHYGHLPTWHKFQRLREDRFKYPDPKGFCNGCLLAESGGQNPPRSRREVEEEEKRRSELLRSPTSDSPRGAEPKYPPEAATTTRKLIRVIPLSTPGQSVPKEPSARFEKWCVQMDRFKRLENDGNWTWEEIDELLDWLPTHDAGEFSWGRVIRSPTNLREHFAMAMAAKQVAGRPRPVRHENEDQRNLRLLSEGGHI